MIKLNKKEKQNLVNYLEREVKLLRLATSLDSQTIEQSSRFKKISNEKKKKILRGGNGYNVDVQGLKAIYHSSLSKALRKHHEKTAKIINGGSSTGTSTGLDLKKVFSERINNLKKHSCSIARTNLDGTPINQNTCYSKDSLKLMVKYWNEKHPHDVIVSETEQYDRDSTSSLHSKIDSKMSNAQYCKKGDEICWAAQQWFHDDAIKDKTFRATIPKGEKEWLSTLDLDFTMKQFEEPYFYFNYLGSHAIDFEEYDNALKGFTITDHLPKGFLGTRVIEIYKAKYEDVLKKPPVRILGIILNLDDHKSSGSHWVAITITCYQDKRIPTEFSYYDSTSCKSKIDCPPDRVKIFYQKVKQQLSAYGYKISELLVNDVQTQFENSECGMYSMRYILMRIHLFDFEESCQNILLDKGMNETRQSIFRKDNGFDTSSKHMPYYRYEKLRQQGRI